MTMTINQKAALKLLGQHTKGSYQIWELSGRDMLPVRIQILQLLSNKAIKRSKAGVTEVREQFYLLAAIDSNSMCLAAQQSTFQEWARANDK